MRDFQPTLDDLHADLAIIGNGSAYFAQAFRRDLGLEGRRILLDPELTAYRAAGLHRGVGATLGLDTLKAGWRAHQKGFRQGSTQGDPWQQGGTFVLTPGGEVPFAHVNRGPGDHPDLLRITAVLRGLAKGAP